MKVISQKIVKTHKPHHCWGCTKLLPTGSEVQAIVSVDGDQIGTSYWCDVCAEVAQDYDDGNGFYYGEMRDAAGERRSLC